MLVSEVVDRTYSEYLYPAGINRPAFDSLNGAILAADETIELSGRLTNVPRDSILEIEDELVLVEATSGSSITVAERGFRETAAADHADDTRVLLNPTFSRKVVFNAMNSILSMLWPWGVYERATADETADITSVMSLPEGGKDGPYNILVRLSGPNEKYHRLSRARQDYFIYREFDPPKYQLLKGVPNGSTITIVFAKEVAQAAAMADDLDTLGVSASLQPYLPMGIAGQLLQGREVPRTQIEDIRRALASQGVQLPPGATLSVGTALLRGFREVYVAAERKRLNELDPPQMEFVGR